MGLPEPGSMTRQALDRLRGAARRLQDFTRKVAEGAEATREELDQIIAEILGAERELFGPRPRAKRGEGALLRIIAYLKAHVGEEIAGEEIGAASGIQEWARRVRELRDENGYDITELGGGSYRLESV